MAETNTNTYSNVFLDGPGVKYLWAKIKEYVNNKEVDVDQLKEDLKDDFASADSVTKDSLVSTLQNSFVSHSDLSDAVDGLISESEVEEMVESSVDRVIGSRELVTTESFANWEDAMNKRVSRAETDAASAEKDAAQAIETANEVSGQFDEFQRTISQQIASVYSFQGTQSSIPTLSGAIKTGYVYNISTSFTTTTDFVEGSGFDYPAGTNIVCVTIDNAKKWDVLAGVFEIPTLSSNEIDSLLD